MQQVDLERVMNALELRLGNALGGLHVERDQCRTHALRELRALFGNRAQRVDQHHDICRSPARDTRQTPVF